MEILSTETFKAKIFDFEKNEDWFYEGKIPAIIDFYADWCGPCRTLAPVIEALAHEYEGRVAVYKVDTEASQDLAALFDIRSIPSLLFVPLKGEPVISVGSMNRNELILAIRDYFGIK